METTLVGNSAHWLRQAGLATGEERNRLFQELNRAHLDHFTELQVEDICLFLPHCLRNRDCPAPSGKEGIRCANCGRCVIGEIVAAAEAIGVKTFVALGGTLVKELVKKHRPKGVVGVACHKEILLAFEVLGDKGLSFQVFELEQDGCFETAINPEPILSFLSRLARKGEDLPLPGQSRTPAFATRCLPETYDQKTLSRLCGEALYAYDTVGPTRAIAEPVRELLSRGGKGMRSRLFSLILQAFGKEETGLQEFMMIPELSHNGSLIIDDIEDDTTHRRGKPCIHRMYGTDVAMNAGNALYFLCLLPLLDNEAPVPDHKRSRILRIYVQAMIHLHFGQSMDIAWHKGLLDIEEISEEHYLQMSSLKTGALFSMSAQTAAVIADAGEEALEALGRFAALIGIAFQIKDDILDIEGEAFSEGKGGSAKDITEGKITLMVIHALHNADRDAKERLKAILASHTEDDAALNEAVTILRECGAPEYASRKARKLVEEAYELAEPFLPTGVAKDEIKAYATRLFERTL